MSFGFSVTDFITLGGLALKLYNEFREAPEASRAFANELLSFHRVLDKLGSDLQDELAFLGASDYAALKACADSCKELLYVQIYGAACVPTRLPSYGTALRNLSNHEDMILQRGPDNNGRFLRAWRKRWGERKFTARIPELQRAVAAHVQSLTAFVVLIVRSGQLRIFACQDRSEALHEQTREYLEVTQSSIETSQSRLEAASERLERSHAKMERQLQGILASQQRRESPILSQSLDASSPEGRETWMNLGRILRAEGITPAVIKQSRDVLVKAMKTTLQGDESSSAPQSYHTAYESFSNHRRTFTDPSSSRSSAQASLSLLGSAPPRGPTFTNEFLERHNGAARSLDQDTNVQDGLQSLLQGMDNYQLRDMPEAVNEYDEMDLEGLNEAHETTETNHVSVVPRGIVQQLEQQKLEWDRTERDRSERKIEEWRLRWERLRAADSVQWREYCVWTTIARRSRGTKSKRSPRPRPCSTRMTRVLQYRWRYEPFSCHRTSNSLSGVLKIQ